MPTHRITLDLHITDEMTPNHVEEAFADLAADFAYYLRKHATFPPPVGTWGSNLGTYDDSSPQTIVVELSSSERITDELPPL